MSFEEEPKTRCECLEMFGNLSAELEGLSEDDSKFLQILFKYDEDIALCDDILNKFNDDVQEMTNEEFEKFEKEFIEECPAYLDFIESLDEFKEEESTEEDRVSTEEVCYCITTQADAMEQMRGLDDSEPEMKEIKMDFLVKYRGCETVIEKYENQLDRMTEEELDAEDKKLNEECPAYSELGTIPNY